MRRFIPFCVVIALVPVQAQADLVSYNMTGTITYVGGYSLGSSATSVHSLPAAALPVSLGDHVSWTVQYDRSTPLATGHVGTNGIDQYFPSGPMFSNVVDQTNGFHAYTAPLGSFHQSSFNSISPLNSYSSLGLTSYYAPSVTLFDSMQAHSANDPFYSIQTNLATKGFLPTVNLADLRLDQVPFQLGTTLPGAVVPFDYTGRIPNTNTVVSFDAQINSITTASIASVPEPATLLLFAVGVLGLAMRRLHRGFQLANPSTAQ